MTGFRSAKSAEVAEICALGSCSRLEALEDAATHSSASSER